MKNFSKILQWTFNRWIYFVLLGFILLGRFIPLFIQEKPYDVIVPSLEATQKTSLETDKRYEQLERSIRESLKKPENLVWITGATLVMTGLLAAGCILLLVWGIGFLTGPARQSDQVPWGLWDVCRVGILAIFWGQIVYVASFLIVRRALGVKVADESLWMLIGTILVDILSFLFILSIVFRQKRAPAAALGLSINRFFSNVGIGILGYLSSLPIFLVILLVVLGVAHLVQYEPPPQPIQELFFMEKARGILLMGALFVAFLAPFFEEVFFRGFLYNALKRRMSPFRALTLNSVLFAFLHANLIGFLPILFLSALLTFLYEKTGSLISSITVHVLHNSLMVGVVFLLKGLTEL